MKTPRALFALLLAAPLACAQAPEPPDAAAITEAERVGVLQPDGVVADPAFGVSTPALGLAREVRMYQWIETPVPGELPGQPPSYRQDWAAEAVDSSAFAEPQGHANPGPLPFASARWFAERALFSGEPVHGAGLWRELDGWQPLSPDPTALPPNLALLFVPDGDGLTSSDDPNRPQIGDLQVRWLALPGGPVRGPLRREGGVLAAFHDGARLVRVSMPADGLVGLDEHPNPARDLWLWLLVAVPLAALMLYFLLRAPRRA